MKNIEEIIKEAYLAGFNDGEDYAMDMECGRSPFPDKNKIISNGIKKVLNKAKKPVVDVMSTTVYAKPALFLLKEHILSMTTIKEHELKKEKEEEKKEGWYCEKCQILNNYKGGFMDESKMKNCLHAPIYLFKYDKYKKINL